MKTVTTRNALTASLCAGVGMVAVLGAFSANATVLALDDFNYPVGEVQGQNGGTGFSSAWGTDAGVPNDGLPYTHVRASGLSYTDGVNSITLPDVGNALELNPYNRIAVPPILVNSQNRGRRDLSATADQGTLFMSFLLKQTGGNITASDSAFLWLGANAQPGNTVARIGLFGQTAGDDFGIQMSDGTAFQVARTGGAVAVGTENLLVVRLSKIGLTGPTDGYDKLELWVNPQLVPSAFVSAPVSIALSSTISSFGKIGFGSASLDSNPNDIVEFDRIRLGTELADVLLGYTAVPEPGTYVAGGAALLLGAGFYLRRRNRAAVAAAA